MVGFLCIKILQSGLKVDTSLVSTLPDVENQELSELATTTLLESHGNKAIFVISGKDIELTLGTAKLIEDEIQSNDTFSLINYGSSTDIELSILDALKPHTFHFVSEDHIRLIEKGDIEFLLQQAKLGFLGFSTHNGALSLSEDPFGTFNHWFAQTYSPPPNISTHGNSIIATNDDGTHVIILAELIGDSLSTETLSNASGFIQSIQARVPTNIDLSFSGMIFHAVETSEKAKRDISLVATGSTLGIILLFVIAFRSMLPLVASLSAIGFGFLSAAAICHTVFGGVHIFTLVFGASLIGVAIDYSLHFFVKIRFDHKPQTTLQTLQCILPEISAGLLTSIIGFGCLSLSSLPTLKQISLFSISGLASSWIFVVALYPIIHPENRISRDRPRLNTMRNWFTSFLIKRTTKYSHTFQLSIFIASISMLVYLAFNLEQSNNIRSLNSSSERLISNEIFVSNLFSRPSPNQYFIVVASSPETVLQKEEQFSYTLNKLQQNSFIDGYSSISSHIPSAHQQHLNYTALESSLFGDNELLNQFANNIGLNNAFSDTLRQRFESQKGMFLNVDTWLQHAPSHISTLWLGQTDDQYASVISLKGVKDTSELAQAANKVDGIVFIDTVDQLSQSIVLQQLQTSYLLIFAYFAIGALCVIRLRTFRALFLVAAPLASSIITLSLLVFFKVEITLFHLFGLFLILGLGMDYGIFISSSRTNVDVSYIAIALSAITSCLSFGLLCLSSIPMIQAFGVTILIGSILNLALAPLAISARLTPTHKATT